MRILVTGSAGFVGRNIVENLKNFRDGKNRTRPGLVVDEIYEYDKDNTPDELDAFCRKADAVIHLAGVNRPKDPREFREGNFGFSSTLLDILKRHHNPCPVILSSSVQATLAGRFAGSEYGLSKRDGEELFFSYAAQTGASVYVYRFPNLVGKFVREGYNSAVGTFCHHIANDLPITVNDPSTRLELLFIDDLMEEIWDALEGHPHRADYPKTGEVIDGIVYDGLTPHFREDGRYCAATVTHKASLGEIVSLLEKFRDEGTFVPDPTEGGFEKKLYSMYISYLPPEKTITDLNMNVDERGSFTELIHTVNAGQVSVNITKPGVTKGLHWHNKKLERFIVVAGKGLIQERRIDSDEVEEYEVSGSRIQSVVQKPGYTHSIRNIGDTDLVTVMWANEIFDPAHPDTFFLPVEK